MTEKKCKNCKCCIKVKHESIDDIDKELFKWVEIICNKDFHRIMNKEIEICKEWRNKYGSN